MKNPTRHRARRRGALSTAQPAWALSVTVLTASIAAGLAQSENPAKAFDGIARAAGFEVRRIHLDGHERTSGSAIVAAVGLGANVSMLTLDADAVRERIESLPWVASAAVRKVYPDALDIAVSEATPVARWRDQGVEVLVAGDGSVVSDRVLDDFRELPLLVGRGANGAVGSVRSLLRARPALADQLAAAVRIAGRRWDLVLDGGSTVMLPEEGASAALDRFQVLVEEADVLAAEGAILDLRLPGRTTIQLMPDKGDLDPGAEPRLDVPDAPAFDDPLARTIAEVAL